jgi:DNA-binding CsgD family transcriptional regulator
MCTEYGYSHFIIAHPPEVGCSIVAEDIILTNLTLYFVDDLVKLNLLSDWSILKNLAHTSAPFSWTREFGISTAYSPDEKLSTTLLTEPSGADALIANEICANIAHCVQAPTMGQRRAFITLFSENEEDFQISFEIVVLIQCIFDRIESLVCNRQQDTSQCLNKRELECLNWVAAGKTSDEIAKIVSLSRHTVNHYLNFCCKKLDCFNRTQAVAKAIRMRLIN